MEAYGHLYFQRVAGYEYLYKYYYIKLLCYCFIFCINNNTDKEHLKFNPCEYSSLSDYLICRLRYFLDDFVCHIPPKIPCTFTFFIIFGKNTKESILTCKILSYLFDFRSNTCVSRRHTVSELILASNSLPAGEGGRARIYLLLFICLPLPCLCPLYVVFCFFLCSVCLPQELQLQRRY